MSSAGASGGLTWHIAHLPFYEITMMTLLLKDGWEPFAADREYVYLRLQGEPPNWPEQHHLLEILPPRYA